MIFINLYKNSYNYIQNYLKYVFELSEELKFIS